MSDPEHTGWCARHWPLGANRRLSFSCLPYGRAPGEAYVYCSPTSVVPVALRSYEDSAIIPSEDANFCESSRGDPGEPRCAPGPGPSRLDRKAFGQMKRRDSPQEGHMS